MLRKFSRLDVDQHGRKPNIFSSVEKVQATPTEGIVGYGEATDPEGLEYDVSFCSQGT